MSDKSKNAKKTPRKSAKTHPEAGPSRKSLGAKDHEAPAQHLYHSSTTCRGK